MIGFGSAYTLRVVLPFVEAALAMTALRLLGKRHAWTQYKSLAAILILTLWQSTLGLLSLLVVNHHIVERRSMYEFFSYSYFSSSMIEEILVFTFCYGLLARLFASSPKLRFMATRLLGVIVLVWLVMSVRQLFQLHANGARFVIAEIFRFKPLEGEISFFTAVTVFLCVRPFGLQLRSPLPAFGLGLIFSAITIFLFQLSTGVAT